MVFLISLLVFVAVFFISAFLLEMLLASKYAEQVLASSGASDTSLPERLSLAVLPRSRVLRSVSLPIPGRDGEEIRLGTVIVSRSGIFILCQINGAGILENPPTEKWKQIYNGRFTEFNNPFITQKDARALIDYYTEASGLPEVKAHSMIIYTNPSLRFTNQRPRGIVYARDFVKHLRRLEKRGRLTGSQIRSACSVLRNADAY